MYKFKYKMIKIKSKTSSRRTLPSALLQCDYLSQRWETISLTPTCNGKEVISYIRSFINFFHLTQLIIGDIMGRIILIFCRIYF